MGTDGTRDKPSLIEQIRKDIAKTGYPTEVVTASLLGQLGWNTVLAPSYLDQKEAQSREFDVRATRRFRITPEPTHIPESVYLAIYLLIECKKSSKPWVFFTTSAAEEREHNYRVGRFIQSPTTKPIFWDNVGGRTAIGNEDWITFHHYIQRPRWGHNYYEPFKGQENSDKSALIYTAIRSVIGALQFYKMGMRNARGLLSVFYPVIVFDGELFDARVVSKEEAEIVPVDHIVLKYNHIASGRDTSTVGVAWNTVLIDVIRASYVSTYSTVIDRESDRMRELLAGAYQDGRLTF